MGDTVMFPRGQPPDASGDAHRSAARAGATGAGAKRAGAQRPKFDSLETQFKERQEEREIHAMERSKTEERLRELTTRLLKAQDDESRRIARELHDSAGQYIAAIQMNLGAMERDAASPLTASQAKRVLDCIEILNLCSDEIRTISYLLHPPLLDEMGLASALAWYSEGFAERSGIRVELDILKGFGRLSTETETAMFRIVQQSLANIYRHSGSHVAMIKVRKNAKEIIMRICDEGCGIAPDILREFESGTRLLGVGIAGMRERTKVMKGSFHVSSSAGGTTIEISLPITENAARKFLGV